MKLSTCQIFLITVGLYLLYVVMCDKKEHMTEHFKKKKTKVLPPMPHVWLIIIDKLTENISLFQMFPYEQQENIQGLINNLSLHYTIDDHTKNELTNFGVVLTEYPKKIIPHNADVSSLNSTPYSRIGALRLVHSLDKIISDNKKEFDETSKYVKTKNFITDLNRTQDAILQSMRRSIGK